MSIKELLESCTPGDWEAEFSEYGGYDCMTAAWHIRGVNDIPILRPHVGTVDCQKDNHANDERREADAKLMALAPALARSHDELLGALKDSVAIIQTA